VTSNNSKNQSIGDIRPRYDSEHFPCPLPRLCAHKSKRERERERERDACVQHLEFGIYHLHVNQYTQLKGEGEPCRVNGRGNFGLDHSFKVLHALVARWRVADPAAKSTHTHKHACTRPEGGRRTSRRAIFTSGHRLGPTFNSYGVLGCKARRRDFPGDIELWSRGDPKLPWRWTETRQPPLRRHPHARARAYTHTHMAGGRYSADDPRRRAGHPAYSPSPAPAFDPTSLALA